MARKFGQTWWGRAWIEALENSVMADAARLSRGRTYARQGKVSMPDILPGSVRAEVTGKEDYVADLSIRVLRDEEWAQLAELIAARSAYSAALLGGELPSDLLAEASKVGIELLPGANDVLSDCSCPDWGDPCKHSAALAYLVADAIDQDPFVLLLLRGRGRTELLDAVRACRARSLPDNVTELFGAAGQDLGSRTVTSGQAEAQEDRAEGSGPAQPATVSRLQGVSARRAYKRSVGPLPTPLKAPARPGNPVVLGTPPPIDSGLRLRELELLAADAAGRATDLLLQAATSGLELSRKADLARRAAQVAVSQLAASEARRPNGAPSIRQAGAFLAMAEHVGMEMNELVIQAIAWEQGGNPGLRVATSEWNPEPHLLEPARLLVGPRSRVVGNTVIGNGTQLRLDQDGLWWRFYPDEELGWILATQGFANASDALDLSS